MRSKLEKLYDDLQKAGLTPEQEQKILLELSDDRQHGMPAVAGNVAIVTTDEGEIRLLNLYDYHDLMTLQAMNQPRGSYVSHIRSSMNFWKKTVSGKKMDSHAKSGWAK